MPVRFAAAFTTCQIALGVMLSPQISSKPTSGQRRPWAQFRLPVHSRTISDRVNLPGELISCSEVRTPDNYHLTLL
jgi:hypothetical protein